MSNGDQIRRVLLDIVQTGLLRIRALGGAGQAYECEVEADHLHNLPRVIVSLSTEEIVFYYEVERVEFLKKSAIDTAAFLPQWKRLETLINRHDLANGPSDG